MKKKLISICTIALTIFSFVQAQSLWDIDVSFCENDKPDQVDLITQSDKDTDICVLFRNNSTEDTTVHIEFVDGILNSWARSCDIPDNPNTKFTKYVKDFDHDIFLAGNSQVERHYTIHYPVWFEWFSHGCISYEIKGEDEDWSQPLNFIFRRVFSIDILVWWSKVTPKLTISKLYLSWYDTTKKIVLEIMNKWNIDQKINLTWTIKNIFWYKQHFEISGSTIGKNQKIELMSNELRIPSYKWFFIVTSNLTNEPIFDFDISNTDLQKEYSTAWLTVIRNYTMLWSRLYITLFVLIILLIIALVTKFSKETKSTKPITKTPKKLKSQTSKKSKKK